jgi:peptidoglycan/xylan/chitin deacetylase (PgdA/CDA1 family)
VLCYHRIRDVTDKDGPVSRSFTTPPATFADQISALKKAGYRTITPDQLRAHLLTGATLPAKSVLLTFDDGSKGQWTAAGPVLKKAGYVATYFVMTVVLGKPDWLTDADLRAMRAAGMTIGSHTWDHHDVRDYTAADWTVQLDGSLARLAKASGGPVTTFAYPYGAWNDAALAPIAARHVGLAFQLPDKPVSPQAPLLTQRRMLVDGRWSGAALLAHLRTAFPKA